MDAAQGIEAQTLANVHLALAQGLVIVPVINKIDLPSAQPEVVMEELENVLAIPREEVILVSAKEGTNIDLVLEAIVARVPPPKGDPRRRSRASSSTPTTTPTRASSPTSAWPRARCASATRSS